MEHVSRLSTFADGFIQSIYESDRFTIILNYITKFFDLSDHSHGEAQFGYCFRGSFLFRIQSDPVLLGEGGTYNLESMVPHGARIEEPIVTLDFKYRTDASSSAKAPYTLHVMEGEEWKRQDRAGFYEIHTLERSAKKGRLCLECSSRETFLLGASSCELRMNGETHYLHEGSIYRVDPEGESLEIFRPEPASADLVVIQSREPVSFPWYGGKTP